MWIFKRNREHISLDVLSEHLDGRLSAADAGRVEYHLESCPRCREEYESLGYTVGLLRRVPGVSPRRVFTLGTTPSPAPAPALQGFRVPTWAYGTAASVAVLLFAVVLSADLTGSLSGETLTPDTSRQTAGAALQTTPPPGPPSGAALPADVVTTPATSPAEGVEEEEVSKLPSEEALDGALPAPSPTPKQAAATEVTQVSNAEPDSASIEVRDLTATPAEAGPLEASPDATPAPVPPSESTESQAPAPAAAAPAEMAPTVKPLEEESRQEDKTTSEATTSGATTLDEDKIQAESTPATSPPKPVVEAGAGEAALPPEGTLPPEPAPTLTPTATPVPTSVPTSEAMTPEGFEPVTNVAAQTEATPEPGLEQVSAAPEAIETQEPATAAAHPSADLGGDTSALWRVVEGILAGVAALLVGWVLWSTRVARRRSHL